MNLINLMCMLNLHQSQSLCQTKNNNMETQQFSGLDATLQRQKADLSHLIKNLLLQNY